MARRTFREILTSYRNQIMARLAGPAGFCLSVQGREPARSLRSSDWGTALGRSRAPSGGMNFQLLPVHPETFSANILGKFNVTTVVQKFAEAG